MVNHGLQFVKLARMEKRSYHAGGFYQSDGKLFSYIKSDKPFAGAAPSTDLEGYEARQEISKSDPRFKKAIRQAAASEQALRYKMQENKAFNKSLAIGGGLLGATALGIGGGLIFKKFQKGTAQSVKEGINIPKLKQALEEAIESGGQKASKKVLDEVRGRLPGALKWMIKKSSDFGYAKNFVNINKMEKVAISIRPMLSKGKNFIRHVVPEAERFGAEQYQNRNEQIGKEAELTTKYYISQRKFDFEKKAAGLMKNVQSFLGAGKRIVRSEVKQHRQAIESAGKEAVQKFGDPTVLRAAEQKALESARGQMGRMQRGIQRSQNPGLVERIAGQTQFGQNLKEQRIGRLGEQRAGLISSAHEQAEKIKQLRQQRISSEEGVSQATSGLKKQFKQSLPWMRLKGTAATVGAHVAVGAPLVGAAYGANKIYQKLNQPQQYQPQYQGGY